MPVYRSKLEERLGEGVLQGCQYEPLKVSYPKKEGRYTPDFVTKTGVWIEVKGFFTPSDRTKMLAVALAYPEQEIRFVFQTPYKTLSKQSDTTYAQWAEKKGFSWCAANDTETLARWAEGQ